MCSQMSGVSRLTSASRTSKPVARRWVERCLHVAGVPEHDDVDDEAEGAELVLLALPVALPQLTFLAVEDLACKLVAGLAVVEGREDRPAVDLILGDEGQVVKRLRETAQLCDRRSQGCQTGPAAERPDEIHGLNLARLQGPRHPEQVVPVIDDHL